MRGVLKGLYWFENALATVAGMLLLLMMLITAVDVMMRYAFNAPLTWGFDLVLHYMLVASFFFSFYFALRLGEHVAVDYFALKFHPGIRRWALVIAWGISGSLAALIAWLSLVEAFNSWKQAEVIAVHVFARSAAQEWRQ